MMAVALPLVVVSILSFAAPGARAQGTPAAEPAGEKMIISQVPEQGSRLHRLLSKMLARGRKRLLGLTHSEVWSVRRSESQRLAEKLQRLGMKVTVLREGWNRILRRHKTAVLTPSQQAVVDKNTRSPETVNVSVLEMPDAAVTEHAMTRPDEPAATQKSQKLPFDTGAKQSGYIVDLTQKLTELRVVRSDLQTDRALPSSR